MNQTKRPNLLSSFLNRFAKNEEGSLAIETIIIVPWLFWSIIASYTFFDGYRQSAANIKAAYAVADIVSREDGVVNDAYIDTLMEVMEFMVAEGTEMNLRVTYFEYLDDEKRHEVHWSRSRGPLFNDMTNSDIAQIKDKLPVMPNYGRMILVETNNLYQRPYKIGFEREVRLENFVFTHPRVFDQIVDNF